MVKWKKKKDGAVLRIATHATTGRHLDERLAPPRRLAAAAAAVVRAAGEPLAKVAVERGVHEEEGWVVDRDHCVLAQVTQK